MRAIYSHGLCNANVYNQLKIKGVQFPVLRATLKTLDRKSSQAGELWETNLKRFMLMGYDKPARKRDNVEDGGDDGDDIRKLSAQYLPESDESIAVLSADDVNASFGNHEAFEKVANVSRVCRPRKILQPDNDIHCVCECV
jgi:hypothetical protein